MTPFQRRFALPATTALSLLSAPSDAAEPVRLAEPGDRILVIYGAGHGKTFPRLRPRDRGHILEDAVPYLDTAAPARSDATISR